MNDTTTLTDHDDTLADELHDARTLRSRAVSLKAQAKALPQPLATTYRRRARELELEAYLIDNVTLLRVS